MSLWILILKAAFTSGIIPLICMGWPARLKMSRILIESEYVHPPALRYFRRCTVCSIREPCGGVFRVNAEQIGTGGKNHLLDEAMPARPGWKHWIFHRYHGIWQFSSPQRMNRRKNSWPRKTLLNMVVDFTSGQSEPLMRVG